MPVLKLKHIASFSSEDPAHPADNLLKSETYRKWQCAEPSEKQASVIIEFEKASKINSLDVGNNGSAFVEVLVGRSSSSDYQVLLVASSFMSPAESKSGTNNNRVRMFGSEKLSKAVADQKWDRVKLVCTQPYNKTSCYGLSFVNFHSPENVEKNGTQEKTQTKLGAFILKDEAVDTITSGSLFAKRKEKTEAISSQAKSTAAELREASKHPAAMTTISTTKHNLKAEKTERKKESETPSSSKRKADSSVTKPADIPKVSLSKDKVQPPVKKAKVAESKEREMAINDILKNVVFVLSGFKNPQRGHLRDKAISMGARYRGDWDTSCTHLICAFKNTPKYSQVKATGKGKIVSQKWVNDCLSRKKRLAEKRYRLGGDDDDSSSTEDEEIPSRQTDKDRSTASRADPKVSPSRESTPQKTTSESTTSREASIREEMDKSESVKENYELQDNTEIIEDNTEIIEDESSSGHDTEDEIRRVLEDKEDKDPYDCSTDCETDDDGDAKKLNHELKDKTTTTTSITPELLNLPDFFSKMTFFLYGEFDSEERKQLIRYITAYDGELEEYMSDNVKYVISNENWDDNFDEALVDNSSLTFVTPKWIYKCHEKRSFVPFQPYIVVPR